MTMSPSLLPATGVAHCLDDHYEVGREKIREYARSVQDGHPVHWHESAAHAHGHPGLVAPLSFIAVPGIVAHRGLFEHLGGRWDLGTMVHTGQRMTFRRPIGAGDRLRSVSVVESQRRVQNSEMVVVRSDIVDATDSIIVTTRTTLVTRVGAAIDPPLQRAVAYTAFVDGAGVDCGRGHTASPRASVREHDESIDPRAYGAIDFDDVHVGLELDPRTVLLTRGNLINYAGVAGDPNPIHFSDEIARLVGLDTVVAQGMQTMGIAAGYLTSFVGDPGAVFEFSVRFTSPVYVPADGHGVIDLTAKVTSLDPATRRGLIALVAKSNGKRVFGRAVANVQFS